MLVVVLLLVRVGCVLVIVKRVVIVIVMGWKLVIRFEMIINKIFCFIWFVLLSGLCDFFGFGCVDCVMRLFLEMVGFFVFL